MSSKLKHSNQGLHNRQLFLEKVNDFNLYVEDTGYEFWYKKIFERMGYKIVSVVSAGDKIKLRKDFDKYGEKTVNGKLNFYITDGDFWRYNSPEKMIDSRCFIYLETYNIESYFIDESYCSSFLQGRLKMDNHGVRNSGFDFASWKENIVNDSYNQFLIYATIESLTSKLGDSRPEISQKIGKTVSNASYKLLDTNTGFVNSIKLKEELEKIMKIFEEEGMSESFNKEYNKITQRYKVIYGENYYNLICGKYLFDSLDYYIRSILKSKSVKFKTIIKEDFKWGCINSFDIGKLNYIKQKIDHQLSA